MTPTPQPPPPATSQPAPAPAQANPTTTWLDHVLCLLGVCVSMVLADMSGIRVARGPDTPALLPEPVVRVLPAALLLPLGPVLFWPVFHAAQRLTGRSAGLSPAEWLLGVAWLGDLLVCIGIVLYHTGTVPDLWGPLDVKHYLVVGYVLGVLSLAVLAVPIWLLDLVRRAPRPWTHRFGLAVLMWPLAPLALASVCGLHFE